MSCNLEKGQGVFIYYNINKSLTSELGPAHRVLGSNPGGGGILWPGRCSGELQGKLLLLYSNRSAGGPEWRHDPDRSLGRGFISRTPGTWAWELQPALDWGHAPSSWTGTGWRTTGTGCSDGGTASTLLTRTSEWNPTKEVAALRRNAKTSE